MEGTGELEAAGSTQAVGLEDVDFWVGGLAERPGVFGSMLGSTFNQVFQRQLEALQFGDRFYYLSRLNGTNLLGQLENNSFGALIARNTDATNLPADVFASPDCVIDVSGAGLTGPVPALPEGCEGSLYREASTGYVRYEGDQHVLMIGSPDEDRIRSGLGDDTIHGTAANDRLEGDDGNDNLFGGDGDDYITDSHGDDVIKAGAGGDRINSGPGLDLLFGGPGKDYISHGATDATESFGGLHDDFIRGGDGIDVVTGNYGDDWLEGGGATDLVQGDNADNLQSDPAGGDDVLISGGGNDDYDAEGGMDIMVAGPGTNRNHGMLGFDWVTNARNPVAADDDMTLFGDAPNTLKPFADRFDLVEGLSGWDMDDILLGDNRSAATEDELSLAGHELTTAKIAKVAGLDVVLGGTDTFTGGNIILGGLGSDLIEGRAGDDVLDGDAWLNVKISGPNGQSYTALSQVQAALFDGSISPRDLSIVREVINPVGEPEEDVVDVAVFSGPQSEYTFPDGLSRTSMRVAHTGGLQTNGTDVLRNFELLRFVVAPGVVEEVSLVEIPNQSPTGDGHDHRHPDGGPDAHRHRERDRP